MSKLYTEEQVRKAWNTAYVDALSLDNKYYKPTFYDDFIASLTPIQLPTDEEIEGFAKDKINLSNDCFGQYDFTSGKQDGFIDGAIWMRDKIKGCQE